MKGKEWIGVIGVVVIVAVVMSLIVYQFLKVNIPREGMQKCPEGTSLMLTQIECSGNQLIFKLKNNGRFDIDGYFIRATIEPNQETATFDLVNIVQPQNPGYVSFGGGLLKPGRESAEKEINMALVVDETGAPQTIHSIEIIPAKVQIDEKRVERIVSCDEGKIKEEITCATI